MLLGHYGVAFAAKKYAPKTSLWLLITAAIFLDLLWPIFLLTGLEKVKIAVGITKVTPLDFIYYPFSHSLLAVIIWAILFGLIYFVITKYKTGAYTLSALVISHWLLDFLVHRADLPITIWGTSKFGLGIWNLPLFTYVLEFGILLFGVYLYNNYLKTLKRWQQYLFYSFVVFLGIIYIINIFSPAPPSVTAIAIAGSAMWLFIIITYFIERTSHRNPNL